MNLILSAIKQAFADQKNPINKYIATISNSFSRKPSV